MKKLLIIPMLFACYMGMGQASAGGGKHFIGEKFGGGIVFDVSPDGLHGLIAETQDQCRNCSVTNAVKIISDPTNHSAAGKSFNDWRLPKIEELNLLYLQKSVVGGFEDQDYFSSSKGTHILPARWNFKYGKITLKSMPTGGDIRSIKSF